MMDFRIVSFNDSRATVKGAESHKKIDLSGNPILRLYYTSRVRLIITKYQCMNFVCF